LSLIPNSSDKSSTFLANQLGNISLDSNWSIGRSNCFYSYVCRFAPVSFRYTITWKNWWLSTCGNINTNFISIISIARWSIPSSTQCFIQVCCSMQMVVLKFHQCWFYSYSWSRLCRWTIQLSDIQICQSFELQTTSLLRLVGKFRLCIALEQLNNAIITLGTDHHEKLLNGVDWRVSRFHKLKWRKIDHYLLTIVVLEWFFHLQIILSYMKQLSIFLWSDVFI
jgi:hypothetical protein